VHARAAHDRRDVAQRQRDPWLVRAERGHEPHGGREDGHDPAAAGKLTHLEDHVAVAARSDVPAGGR
jgi:hypothetical protein